MLSAESQRPLEVLSVALMPADPNDVTHSSNGGHNLSTTSSTNGVDSTGKKPSMMDKLNPKKNADDDGKVSIMK